MTLCVALHAFEFCKAAHEACHRPRGFLRIARMAMGERMLDMGKFAIDRRFDFRNEFVRRDGAHRLGRHSRVALSRLSGD
jgi:hypothetical protein